MRKQKGQAIVEFTLVFPLMLLFLWVLLYGGLLFKDYLTLSNLARDSARSATFVNADYDAIRTNGAQQTIMTNLYTWSGNADSFQITDEANHSVRVTLTTTLNTDFPGVGLLNWLGVPLPENYRIVYSMHKES